MREIWKSIPGYEGMYEASDQGRIRSVERVDRSGKRRRGKLLSPWPNNRGYLMVNLGNGESKTFLVHRKVLEAFVGPCPDGMEACHHNGVRTENRLSNIRWGTREENREDLRRHGTHWIRPCKGSANASSKLRESDIPTIFEMRRGGATQVKIAKRFGVSHRTIGSILSGEKWRHLGVVA